MPFIIKAIIAFALSAIGLSVYHVPQPRPDMASITPTDKPYEAVGGFGQVMADIYRFVPPATTTTLPVASYRHGDCSWLPAVALQAGWQRDQIDQVQEIATRESGCCPARIGGQRVLADCTPNGFSETDHMSDSGTMQINSINFDINRNPTAPICLQMGICTQEPLLDPLTNLKAAKLLFDYWEKAAGNGWIPWDMCNRTRTCNDN